MFSTGMSLEEVRDQFDVPRLEAFNSYTERFPPQYLLIAGYFGFGKEKSVNKQEDVEALLASFPQTRK
jgi:hypothetical protein